MGQQQRVLIADDELSIRHVLSSLLRREGLEVVAAENGEEALEKFHENRPDLVLLDLMMPKLNGFEVCERIKSDRDDRLVPVILVTASSSQENKQKGLEAGADDFLAKPVDRLELLARVRSMLRIKKYTDELERAESVLFALARSIEGKDPYTENHCERLSRYGAALGKRLGLPPDQIEALRIAGIVHDIGKVAVPDAVLLKNGPLTREDREIINQHPVVGENICKTLKSFRNVLPIIRHHHEKMNGTGYPDGLAGEEIPLTARVLTVVDVYDALKTERPYKRALSTEEVFEIMQDEVDKGWWDPAVFDEFRKMIAETEPPELDAAVEAAFGAPVASAAASAGNEPG